MFLVAQGNGLAGILRYALSISWGTFLLIYCVSLVDDSAEHEIWFPHGIAYPEGSEYPPTIAHSITCFRWMCRLSIIFNQILIHMYDPTKQYTDEDVKICLQNEEQSLKQ